MTVLLPQHHSYVVLSYQLRTKNPYLVEFSLLTYRQIGEIAIIYAQDRMPSLYNAAVILDQLLCIPSPSGEIDV